MTKIFTEKGITQVYKVGDILSVIPKKQIGNIIDAYYITTMTTSSGDFLIGMIMQNFKLSNKLSMVIDNCSSIAKMNICNDNKTKKIILGDKQKVLSVLEYEKKMKMN